ncbi:DegT/DnrJ/EryC1/StrS family aminotransferase [Mitsuaria sp. GD03876]|uniref:DegT/DnrJ/EryC1/StrS family aminotransferase n=1 Tax=Mitsuaria sp. GD03876 TaxID=2975399 RepID=UPI002448362D|nr:DegT/DnrJ/EryC1/StrS family aminotransferase [Mitsuaria sp. GD03876]MDH0863252.1 DegT/DnrJ/EryC1/StrS family aminotransferase [Mitsuaria sp. GD03876]
MKGHVAGALRWRDLPAALLHWLRRGDASAEDFRAAFAASLRLDPATAGEVRLFGTGRAALHAFVAALDLPPGSEVLLPGYTCVVVPNVFMHLGLAVRYVDIARDDFNPSPAAISDAIASATRLVVVPHNFGLVTEGLDVLRVKHPDVVFVEDAAHAWGSTDAIGRTVGTLGQAAFFSFEYSKPLTTGIGGALVIHDPALRARFAARMPALRPPSSATVAKQLLTLGWHRLTMNLPRPALTALTALLRAPSRMLGVVAKTPDSEVAGDTQPDYRAGLHPLSAAIGLTQARRHEEIHAQRRAQAQDYDALLTRLPGWESPVRAPGAVLLRYPLLLSDTATRDAAVAALEAAGIVGGTWFDDVVHPRGSRRFGYAEGDCPNGERAARTVLNLPLGRHARLGPSQRAAVRAIAERHGGLVR